MKSDRLKTRRKPVKKTVYARLFNKTKTKKQRATAATANSSEEVEEGGINISRSLTIIFAIHILAIGMIFVHKQYLSDRTPLPGSNEAGEDTAALPRVSVLSDGDQRMLPKKGDNYKIIAARYGVSETDLRNANTGVAVRPGKVLRIPQGRRIVAEIPPEVTVIRDNNLGRQSDRGLVEIGPRVETVKPTIVRPVTQPVTQQAIAAPKAEIVSSGRSHVIRSGDNIWRIANEYNVSQQAVLTLNNITDPTRLKIGQVIKLP